MLSNQLALGGHAGKKKCQFFGLVQVGETGPCPLFVEAAPTGSQAKKYFRGFDAALRPREAPCVLCVLFCIIDVRAIGEHAGTKKKGNGGGAVCAVRCYANRCLIAPVRAHHGFAAS